MADRGPPRATTPGEILGHIEASDRPVHTISSLSEDLDVSRPTIEDRFEEVKGDSRIRCLKVGNTEAYYLSKEDPRPVEERHAESIVHEFTDKFVGLPTAPWTAVHPNDGPVEAGGRVQIRVEGVPGRWRQSTTHTWENRREELIYEETSDDETQALISGELYAKPTVPIEHVDYPDDYELELNIGAEFEEIEGRTRQILLATGVKNYLIHPCNNAVFLSDVSVDWISPKGAGPEIPHTQITMEDLEELLEQRGQTEALERVRGEGDDE